MLKLEGLKLAPEEKEAALHRKAARLLRIPEEDVLSVQVLRRSIDAREELHLVYTVAAEVRQEKQVDLTGSYRKLGGAARGWYEEYQERGENYEEEVEVVYRVKINWIHLS